jgi:hypothetical protein
VLERCWARIDGQSCWDGNATEIYGQVEEMQLPELQRWSGSNSDRDSKRRVVEVEEETGDMENMLQTMLSRDSYDGINAVELARRLRRLRRK